VRVGGIIVTWRILEGKRGDRLTRALSKLAIRQAWALGLVAVLTLAGCSFFGGGSSGSGDQSLTQISWCDRKDINFQDQSATNADPLTSWNDVKNQLGFAYYLPASFPKGTCLVFAGGTIHDSVFNGGKFDITYNLPESGPIAFVEVPKQSNASTAVQCVQSAQDAKTNVCQGVVGQTSVTIASPLSTSAIQNYFSSLKSNLAWVPAVEPTAAPSPTVTATPKP
jgi:hypothetical protein